MMRWVWTHWLLLVIGTFGAIETIGYFDNGTLSGSIRFWTTEHPLLSFWTGCGVGALSFHLWG